MVRVDVKKLQGEIIAQMLTQNEVARQTSLSAATICRILKGENLVQYRTAAKLEHWLRHSPPPKRYA